MQREYIAFISYRHKDLDISVAKKLHRLIEHYRVPSEYADRFENRKLGYVFRDQDELPISADLSANIQEALDQSEFLIVICSPDTPESIWVEREIAYFLKNHDRNHILTVLASGLPSESFPEMLVNIRNENGEIVDYAEPLAANIVSESKSQTLRKLKNESFRIFAAMLGCSYDALYQRERRYKLQRIAIASLAAVLTSIAFIVLLLSKNTEIAKRNQQLILQKQEIQRNESRLLVKDARENVEDGNEIAAIANAIAALPEDRNDDRPYNADAESILIQCLGVFDDDFVNKTYINHRGIELDTPVVKFEVDDSGQSLVALDDFGMLSCVNPYSGSINWQSSVSTEEPTITEPFADMVICNNDSTVIAIYDRDIVCIALDDGHEVWRQGLKYTAEPLFCLSDDAEYLAIMVTADKRILPGDSSFSSDFDLLILRASNGELCHRIAVAKEKDYFDFQLQYYAGKRIEKQNGLYFDNNHYFIGYYYTDNKNSVCFYMADIEAETLKVLYTEACDDFNTPIISIDISPELDSFVFIKGHENKQTAAVIKGIDISTGEILWTTETPANEENEFLSYDMVFQVLPGTNTLLFSAGNQLYSLKKATGEILASVSLYDSVTGMTWINNSAFAFSLANGYYAVGWRSSTGFYDSRQYDYSFNVGQNTDAAFGGGGMFIPVVEDGAIDHFMKNDDKEAYGYIATLPNGSQRTIQIQYFPSIGENRYERVIAFPDEGYMPSDEDTIPSIHFYEKYAVLSERQYGSNDYSVKNLNTETFEWSPNYSFQFNSLDEPYLLPSGKGMVCLNSMEGTVTYHDFDTSEAFVWAQTQTVELSRSSVNDEDDLVVVADDSMFVAAYRFDGRLITAICDGQQIRWWINDNPQSVLELPVDVTWQVADNVQYFRLMEIGANGFIVISDFGDGQNGKTMKRFVAYDTVSGKWLNVDDTQNNSADRMISIGDVTTSLAVYEKTGEINVYDMSSNTLKLSLNISLPQNYICGMQFILNDAYLLVRTEGDELLVYDLSDGNCVFDGQMKVNKYHSQTEVVEDGSGRRIFLIDQYSHEAIVFSKSGWEELARISNVYGYDKAKDEIYLYSYSKGFVARKVWDLWEMIEVGNNMASQ